MVSYRIKVVNLLTYAIDIEGYRVNGQLLISKTTDKFTLKCVQCVYIEWVWNASCFRIKFGPEKQKSGCPLFTKNELPLNYWIQSSYYVIEKRLLIITILESYKRPFLLNRARPSRQSSKVSFFCSPVKLIKVDIRPSAYQVQTFI